MERSREGNRNGSFRTIVVADEEDERFFISNTRLEHVLLLSRPVPLLALYEKMLQIEKECEDDQEKNLAAFREYVNEDSDWCRRKRILVVDDDSEQLMNIKEQLEEFYDVGCVRSGAAAFKYLAKKKCDLILLDYLMPEMDGPEVLRNIQDTSDWADIPVIFLTGVTEKNKVIQTLAELRPSGYLVKPSKKSEIVAKIIDILG